MSVGVPTVVAWVLLVLGIGAIGVERIAVDRGTAQAAVGLLLVYGGLIGMLRVERWRGVLLPVLLLVVCVEAVWFSGRSLGDRPVLTRREMTEKTGYNDYSVEALDYVRARDPGFYRVSKNYASGPAERWSLNDAKVQDYFGTASYFSFNQIHYVNFLAEVGVFHTNREDETRFAAGLLEKPLLGIWASVKYLLVKGASAERSTLGFRPVKTFGDVTLFENQVFLPLGFTYDRVVTESAYATLRNAGKQVSLLRGVVVEDAARRGEFGALSDLDVDWGPDLESRYTLGMVAADLRERREDVLELESFSQTAVRGSIALERPKLLFFSIPYDAGWSARVDGAPARLHRVNIGFLGLLLPAGRHEVELTYATPYLGLMILVSIVGFAVFGFLLAKSRSAP